MNENFSFTDVATLRQQARAHTEDGAVTAGYSLDRPRLLTLLNEALATELVCVMRYRRHHFVAHGLRAQAVAEEFMVHAIRSWTMRIRLLHVLCNWVVSRIFLQQHWRLAAMRNILKVKLSRI